VKARGLGILGLGLALLTAASPPRVELSRTVCTPRGRCVTLIEKEGDVPLLEEKLPRKLSPGAEFGLWLLWPMEEEARRREFTQRPEDLLRVAVTPAGRFELFSPARTEVRRSPKESPGPLVYVSFDPREKAPLKAAVNEVALAAQERGLLTPEQQQALAARQKALEERIRALVRVMEAFLIRPGDLKARGAFLGALLALFGEELDPNAPAVAPERFLSATQRTTLRKAGYEVLGQQSREYAPSPEVAYTLTLQAYSVDQLVREWNAGLRGPASGIEDVPRPGLEVERARRHDDVSFTLTVRNDTGRTRMEQVLQRLLEVPGVRLAPGPPLPPPR
jgi:hypothetical protein